MKYPKTFHVPWSPGINKDDKVQFDLSHFDRRNIIVTEKLDGECTSLFKNNFHARSENNNFHITQTWIRNKHAEIKYLISNKYQIIGENVFAKHSVYYDKLTTYFYVFGIIELFTLRFLDVHTTQAICRELGLEFVPILWQGNWNDFPKQNFTMPQKSMFGEQIEGYVIRITDEFSTDCFQNYCVKYVRSNHVQSENNWRKIWIKNKLMEEK